MASGFEELVAHEDAVKRMNDTSERRLTLKITLRVSPGLKANIRLKRVNEAISQFESFLQGYASCVFPWAESVQLEASWDYRHLTHLGEPVPLPATRENSK